MIPLNPIKWWHRQAEFMLLYIRRYMRRILSYRDLEEIMAERGLFVDQSTLYNRIFAIQPLKQGRISNGFRGSGKAIIID